jgi:hypothetical protein
MVFFAALLQASPQFLLSLFTVQLRCIHPSDYIENIAGELHVFMYANLDVGEGDEMPRITCPLLVLAAKLFP